MTVKEMINYLTSLPMDDQLSTDSTTCDVIKPERRVVRITTGTVDGKPFEPIEHVEWAIARVRTH